MEALSEPRWPWYLHGPTGRGKTFIAAAVFRHWPDSGVGFWNAQKILLDYVMDRQTAGLIMNSVKDFSLIVLDDVGLREPTGAQLDALLAILNARHCKPLIITGNNDPVQLNKVLDERCGGRICGGTVFEVLGEDHRLKQAKLFEI